MYSLIFKIFFLIQIFDNLITAVGNKELYMTARENPRDNKKLSTMVVDSLQAKHQRQGTQGEIYKKEEKFFTEAMAKTFYSLMVGLLYDTAVLIITASFLMSSFQEMSLVEYK